MKQADFLVIPLHRRDGKDLNYLPGFHSAKAPRNAARRRKGDRILLHLNIEGALALTDIQIQEMLSDIAKGYFQSSGSTTAALKEQAERLNSFLLEQNRAQDSEAPKSVAFLSMLLVRSSQLILAQSGPVHGFLLNAEGVEHFYDPENAGRGLGLIQQTRIRFFHFELEPEDIFLALSKLPEGWNEKTLQNVRGQKLATLRRRFLADAGTDLSAMMLAAKEGTGDFKVLITNQEVEEQEPDQDSAKAGAAIESFTDPQHTQSSASSQSWENIEVPDENVQEQSSELNPEREQPPESAFPDMAAGPEIETSRFGEIRDRGIAYLRQALHSIQRWMAQILPEDGDFNLPSSTMAWIAGLVPLLVVLLVLILYFQVGRGQLYTNNFVRAQAAVNQAAAISDPLAARESWELALQYAQGAASYEDTEEVGALRLQAQEALDDMDAIERLDFQLALFDDLSSDVQIKRMLATNTELYMLDANEGMVLRAFLTGGGYKLDDEFQCGPGPYGGFIVGPLVDIALLPSTNPQDASLVAMDADGNLVYCIIDQRPIANALEAPDINWGNPNAIAIENENLHVLDPLANAVWLYTGEEYSFVEKPRFYFAAEVPNLKEAIDLDLQGDDLVVLKLNGEVALCRFSSDLENPTTCEDPAEFQDGRPGRSNGPQIEGAHFLQLQATDPPEPSIFLFDPIAHSVYQFSLRLNLVRQYRSTNEISEGMATAFAVSPNRAIFIAIDNQLFIAFLP